MTDPITQRAQEQLPVALFDGAVLAVRGTDGRIFLSLRDVCELLGLDLSSQRRRIRGNDRLTLAPFIAVIQGQVRTADFLLLEDVPLWLLTIQLSRVTEQVRPRIDYIKSYLVASVQRAFGELTGLATLGNQPSSSIEDLRDLDRIEAAFQQLDQLASRQDNAAIAFRDMLSEMRELRDRLQQVEQQIQLRISPEQRGTIYAMVQRWGEARAAQVALQERGTVIRRCWAEVNARFKVSTYTDLPASRYDEIVQFVKKHDTTLTGQELEATQQGRLEL
jgi:P22_AR N-terminal domain